MSNRQTFETSFEFLTNEATASIGLNPFFKWAKFVLTDDDVNLNNQKIPESEFDNLIMTGVYTPLKMDFNQISNGHKEAEKKPIGVITHIKKDVINNRNSLVALAALWKKERPDDVSLLEEMASEGNLPKVSWEISYHESEFENDVEILKGTILTGVAIVANPAYADRAKFLAIASVEDSDAEKWSRKYINDLPDSAFLYIEDGGKKDEEGKTVPRSLRHLPYKDDEGNIDLPHLRNAIVRLSQENTGEGWLTPELRKRLLEKARRILKQINKEENATMELEEALAKIGELEKTIGELQTQLQTYEAELEELRLYKQQAEAEKEAQIKLENIKRLFADRGIEKPESYFEENKDMLLNLSDSALEFMVQELVSFASRESKTAKASVPNVNTFDGAEKEYTPSQLAKLLKEIL